MERLIEDDDIKLERPTADMPFSAVHSKSDSSISASKNVDDLKKNPLSDDSPLKVESPIDTDTSTDTPLSKSDDITLKPDTSLKGNNSLNTSRNLTQSDVRSMIRKEISKVKTDLQRGNKPTSQPSSSPQSKPSSALTPKGKKHPTATSKSPKGKTTPTPQQSLSKPHFYGSYNHLEVVNINKELVYRLPYFISQKITDYSSKMNCNYGIISVCDGSRDVNTNMNYTLSLITDFINYNYTYIPIYLKTETNEIEDIVFVVFQFRSSETDEDTEQRTFYDLQRFLKMCGQKYSVREYFVKLENQFISITTKGNLPMKERIVRDVLVTYLNHRKVVIREISYFYFNPTPTNIVEKYERLYSRNEICL